MELNTFIQEKYKNLTNNKSSELLQSARASAYTTFEKLGVPTTKHEEWKFTNLQSLAKGVFSNGLDTKVDQKDLETVLFPFEQKNKVVLLNGIYNNALSSCNELGKIIVSSLAEATQKYPQIVEAHYNKIANTKEEALTALNTALAEDGLFIHIPKSVQSNTPIYVYVINTCDGEQCMINPRNLIIAEENSQARIVFKYVTLGNGASFTNEVTEISVAKNANIHYYKIQDDKNASHVGTTEIAQSETSIFTAHTISLSGKLIRNNLNIRLNGEHIESHMNGLYLIKGNTHVDNHTVADHKFPNCYSNELYKGIIDEKANGVFNGKIFVRPQAQKTNAFQSNKNILLSDDAKINTKPQLEIWADDVKCSHGATSGQLDDEALFYLKARGIGEKNAKALLLRAFAGEVIDRLGIEELENFINTRIESQLSI